MQRIALDDSSWVDVVRGFLPVADEVHDDLLGAAEWEQAQWRWTSRRGRRDPNPPYSAPRRFSPHR